MNVYIFFGKERGKLNDQAKNKCHFHFKMAKEKWKFNDLKVTDVPTLFKKCTQDLMIYVNSRLASFSLVGHAAEAQWQIIKQGMEEEVCHPV